MRRKNRISGGVMACLLCVAVMVVQGCSKEAAADGATSKTETESATNGTTSETATEPVTNGTTSETATEPVTNGTTSGTGTGIATDGIVPKTATKSVTDGTASGTATELSANGTDTDGAETEDGKEKMTDNLVYDDYSLVWEEQFEGDSLNLEDWNIEIHEPGWVNNELQEYIESAENIYIEDGKLVLKPVRLINGDGSVSYTSGRVNTQNKHDFQYGIFEARLKVPKGKGFLPAFWMMPTDEYLYGQWPRCGEMDIMEVLGNDTGTTYGTIHYGIPHNESQGSYTLEEGNFSDEYHVFSLKWEPGELRWYVDGKLMFTESNWFSATEEKGKLDYPAPFDQPFYIILNLAVGGNWPGSPDDTTDIDSAAYMIDYVRVYQKD